MRTTTTTPWAAAARNQAGIVTRAQMLASGATPATVRTLVEGRRFQVVLPGVYATFTGPLPEMARVWAAVLWAGRGAAAGGRTALWLAGLLDVAPRQIEVCVPFGQRRRAGPSWIKVRARRRCACLVHPAATPPRLRLEEALLDEIESMPPASAISLVLSAVQKRLTTAARLELVLGRRARHSRRRLLEGVLSDAAQGVHSFLEREYVIRVERAHGLPRGVRNAPAPGTDPAAPGAGFTTRSRYCDVSYPAYRVIVELDGIAWHRGREAEDRARDRRAVLSGEHVLRFGWPEVMGDPCTSAREVGTLLRRRGWRGSLRTCGPACRVNAECR